MNKEPAQPTAEQLKGFWEGCGLHKELVTGGLELYCDNEHNIVSPTDNNGIPILDLNNLFKYAVPKAIKSLQEESKAISPPLQISEGTAFRELIGKWLAKSPLQFGLEATLFQTIDQIREAEREEDGLFSKAEIFEAGADKIRRGIAEWGEEWCFEHRHEHPIKTKRRMCDKCWQLLLEKEV